MPSPAKIPTDAVTQASAMMPPAPVRRSTTRQASTVQEPRKPKKLKKVDANPDTNPDVLDDQVALRASPDAEEAGESLEPEKAGRNRRRQAPAPATPKTKSKAPRSDSSLSDLSDVEEAAAKLANKTVASAATQTSAKTAEVDAVDDPEADEAEEADPEELVAALSRPPPVNSSYLPLPWKGRLGYACLCTYLRAANPPVFSSRTCRIASILEHRHPMKDPSQPEHATKNRPDKTQPADVARGQAYVEALGLANVRDIPKMLRWNDKYGIKFFRLSSEMFPFASHDVYGYKLAAFASEALAAAGKVVAELGHRVTTHPGQFTQLGSPRPEVISASIKDLAYHCEMLDLLRLPPQQNRDAVMILHMGGVFGDKAATLDRFRHNYAKLPQGIKNRLVLENDDVCYSVHDLLPICEELNIPFVLDYHHHNIIFDSDKIREGTLDIMHLYDRIKANWTRKNITQKMHYSEPTPAAITGRQRRKHNPRVATLPPCAPDMDLMIEAKDKEQAVFELMRTFKLPGYDTFNEVIPYQRSDENKAWKPPKRKTPKKKKDEDAPEPEPEPAPPPIIPDDEVGMGGLEGRVYWPLGMEEWLRPKRKIMAKKDPEKARSLAERAAEKRAEKKAWQEKQEADNAVIARGGTPVKAEAEEVPGLKQATKRAAESAKKGAANATAKKVAPKKRSAKTVPTPSTSDADSNGSDEVDDDDEMLDLNDEEEEVPVTKKKPAAASRRKSGRGAKKAVVYADVDEEEGI